MWASSPEIGCTESRRWSRAPAHATGRREGVVRHQHRHRAICLRRGSSGKPSALWEDDRGDQKGESMTTSEGAEKSTCRRSKSGSQEGRLERGGGLSVGWHGKCTESLVSLRPGGYAAQQERQFLPQSTLPAAGRRTGRFRGGGVENVGGWRWRGGVAHLAEEVSRGHVNPLPRSCSPDPQRTPTTRTALFSTRDAQTSALSALSHLSTPSRHHRRHATAQPPPQSSSLRCLALQDLVF